MIENEQITEYHTKQYWMCVFIKACDAKCDLYMYE